MGRPGSNISSSAAPRNTWCAMHRALSWSSRATNGRCSLHKRRTNLKTWAIIILSAFVCSANAAEAPKRKLDTASNKALTYANVVSFFKEARLHPVTVQKRCTVFFEGEFKNANVYNYCLIIVENSDEDVQ